jgi:hypothetical protein
VAGSLVTLRDPSSTRVKTPCRKAKEMSQTLNFPATVPDLFAESLQLCELTEADIPAWFARATDVESADLAGDSIPESIEMGAVWPQPHRCVSTKKRAFKGFARFPAIRNRAAKPTIALSTRCAFLGVADGAYRQSFVAEVSRREVMQRYDGSAN